MRTLFILIPCFTISLSCDLKSNKGIDSDSSNTIILTQNEIEDTTRLNLPWDEFQFTDRESKEQTDKIEQAIIEYISAFPQYSNNVIQASLNNLIKKTESSSSFYEYLNERFEHYLYNPNSPIRNDLYFEKVLTAYLASPNIDEKNKIRNQALLDLVKLNQVGTQASDFTFIDRNDKIFKMHNQQSKYKLLIFYDPLCSQCHEIIRDMQESTLLQQAIQTNTIIVIAIDPTNDYNSWRQHQNSLPTNWLIGFDKSQQILKKPTYNILGYPTLYLLDSNNYVLLKDVSFFKIEEFLLLNN